MLSVAAGRVDISPRLPTAVGVDARTSAHADGPLEANVVILEGNDGLPIVLAVVDSLFVDTRMQTALCDRIGIDAARVMLFASHTHSAPMLTNELAPPATINTAYAEDVALKLAGLVQQLLSGPRSRVSTGFGQCKAALNINRRTVGLFLDMAAAKRGRISLRRRCAMQPNRFGIVDPAVRVLRLTSDAGRTIAILWGFAAHPSRQPDPQCVSADFPGRVRDGLRAQFGDEIAVLYLPGFAGSTVPRIPRSVPRSVAGLVRLVVPFVPSAPTFTPRSYDLWCKALSDLVITTSLDARSFDAHISACSSVVSAPIFECHDRRKDVALEVKTLSFGPQLVLAATSGEPLAEWQAVLAPHIGEHVWLTGYLAGRPIYVPTRAAIEDGGYEVEGFVRPFGLAGRFVDNVDDLVHAAIIESLRI